jgi:hypothetical protein
LINPGDAHHFAKSRSSTFGFPALFRVGGVKPYTHPAGIVSVSARFFLHQFESQRAMSAFDPKRTSAARALKEKAPDDASKK